MERVSASQMTMLYPKVTTFFCRLVCCSLSWLAPVPGTTWLFLDTVLHSHWSDISRYCALIGWINSSLSGYKDTDTARYFLPFTVSLWPDII